MNEPGGGWLEAARLEVEGPESFTVLEVDMKPFTPRRLGVQSGEAYQVGADAAAPVIRSNLRVEKESVIGSVPSDIDKPYEGFVNQPSRRPAEAVRPDALPPAGCGASTVGLGEGDQLIVRQRTAPLEADTFEIRQDRPLASRSRGRGGVRLCLLRITETFELRSQTRLRVARPTPRRWSARTPESRGEPKTGPTRTSGRRDSGR